MTDAHEGAGGVIRAIDAYFQGFETGEENDLASIFHPEAVLTSVAKGRLFAMDVNTFIMGVSERGPVSSARRIRLVHAIHMLSPTAAFVHVEDADETNRYSDGLLMHRLADGWRIVSKSWSILGEDY